MVTRRIGVRGATISPYCAHCPCAKDGKPKKVVPSFGGTTELCIVGEGPGTTELQQGYPFIGPSGKVVNLALKQAGIDRGHIFFVNALLCARPSSDEALAEAVTCCRERMLADIKLAQPKAICALGNTAMTALALPYTSVMQARGTVQESTYLPGIPVIGSMHPAALLRGGAGEMSGGGKQKMNVDAQATFLFADIAKAYAISVGKIDAVWSDDVRIVYEVEKVEAELHSILEEIYAWGILGLDLEWICPGRKNALDALGANAYMAQITWTGIGYPMRAVSFQHEALVQSGMLPVLQAAMEDPDLAKLCHNKQADIAIWEAQVGPIRGRRMDTMLMHHAAFPGANHELQQTVAQFLCVPPWKILHKEAVTQYLAEQKIHLKEEKAAKRKADHEARNAARKAEREERQRQKQEAHAARNAARAAAAATRKGKKGTRATTKASPDSNPGEGVAGDA